MIGAGPVGLAAAAHLVERGLEPLVLEAGPAAGSAVREWAHVRLFSTWARARRPGRREAPRPDRLGPRPTAPTYPTGGDWAERYLQPLADVLGDQVRYGATVTGVSRAGRDRIVDADREQQPFTVHVAERRRHARSGSLARAVIDASGTWSTPEPDRRRRPARPRREGRRRPHLLPRPRPQGPGRTRPVRGQAHRRHRLRRLRLHRPRLPRRPRQGRDGTGTHAVWILRRGISGSTFGGGERRPAPRPRRPRPRREGRRRRRPRRRGHRLPHRRRRARRRRPAGPASPRTAAAWTRSTRSSS